MTEFSPRTDWFRLGTKIETPMSDDQAAFLKHRIFARRVREIRRRIVLAGVGALCLFCATGFWTITVSDNAAAPKETQLNPRPFVAHGDPKVNIAEALETGTRFTLEEEAARRIYQVAAGAIRFERSKTDTKSIEVRVGGLVIEDIGTIFTVKTLPMGRAEVAVQEGLVRITWADGSSILAASESGAFPPLLSSNTGTVCESDKELPPRTRNALPVDWRALARQGQYKKALTALEKDLNTVPNRVPDLLLAADVMRLGGKPKQAAVYLSQVLHEHSGDPRAGLAAFTLGRVYLDELGRPRDAARIFRQAGGGNSPLSEEALAREVEAWSRAGDAVRAREAAKRYLERYPKGDRVEVVRAFGGLDDR